MTSAFCLLNNEGVKFADYTYGSVLKTPRLDCSHNAFYKICGGNF